MKRISFIVSGLLLLMWGCNNENAIKDKPLCPRNEYSRNGVDTVKVYTYKATMGKIDPSSRKLVEVYKYDSLGNVVYYRGNNPLFSSFNSLSLDKIKKASYLSDLKTEDISVHFEYIDTTLLKIMLFNKEGRYFARIQHSVSPSCIEDSIYVNRALTLINRTMLNKEGKDSVIYEYTYSNDRENLESKSEYFYSQLEDGTHRTHILIQYKGSFYEKDKKMQKTEVACNTRFDEKGRPIYQYQTMEGLQDVVGHLTYSDDGLSTEIITNAKSTVFDEKYNYREVKNKYKNGLPKDELTYQDMTIEDSKKEYKYTFYPYSKSSVE